MLCRVETPQELNSAIIYLSSRLYVAVDTETTGLDIMSSDLLLLQIGNGSVQYVLDIYKLRQSGANLDELKRVLENGSIIKVLHNAKFDYKVIKYHLGITLKNIVCLFVQEHLLKKGILQKGYNLAEVSERYIGIDLEKSTRETFANHQYGEPFTDEQLEYAAKDVEHLIDIMLLQQRVIEKYKMQELANLENEAVFPTGDMELNGVYISPTAWRKLYTKSESDRLAALVELEVDLAPAIRKYQREIWAAAVAKETEKISKKLQKKSGNTLSLDLMLEDKTADELAREQVGKPEDIPVNLNSSTQMKRILSLHIGKTIESTEEEALSYIDHPIIPKVVAYRKASKLVTTYGEEFLKKAIHPKTGRIHTNFNQTRADSGRYSSSDPVNLQNIPHQAEYRAAFRVQDSSWRMISADYSSCELRLLAELSKENSWIEAFNAGKDMHSFVASMLFKIPYEELVDENDKVKPQYKEFRNKAKILNFATAYGAKAGRLANQLKIPYEEAKALLDNFWVTFPSIEALLTKLARDAVRDKVAISPLDNRRRVLFFDMDDRRQRSHAENIAKNMPFQGKWSCKSALFVL